MAPSIQLQALMGFIALREARVASAPGQDNCCPWLLQGAPGVSGDVGEAAMRHQMQLHIHTGSNLGGKSQPLHHMGF